MQRIRTTLTALRAWWRTRRLRTKTLIIIAIIVALFVAFGGKKDAPVIDTVVRADLAQTVTATGTVVSATDLALSFQKSNIVRSVAVAVGQKVSAGQVLATLSNASEAAAVASARGTLLAAEARERKVREGSSDEAVRKAETALVNARRTLYSSDLVARTSDGEADATAPVVTGAYEGSEAGSYRIYFDTTVNQAKFSGLEKGWLLVGKVARALGTRGLMVAFPGDSYGMGDEWVVEIPNKNGAHYAANLSAYHAAEADLEEVRASARSADLDAALAEVVSAEGALAQAQAQYEQTVIRAPAAGTVTKVDISIGDLAETYDAVIAVQDIENLYLEANVNESGIAGLSIGQPVSVTYDALGKDRRFSATIASVDLSPTVVDGIVNYKIKALVTDASTIKPGMTANLSVQTAFAPSALVIPERAIREDDGRQTVEVLVDARKGKTETRAVATGLRGDGGLIEIVSGLSEGERVVEPTQ